jgi:hypothetical protein
MELLEQNGVVGGDLFPFGCRSTFCLYYEALTAVKRGSLHRD